MRRIALAFLAATTLSAGAAQSAFAASATYNWSGWYLGLNGGGNWGTSHASTTAANGFYFPYLSGFFFSFLCPGITSCNDAVASAGNQRFNTSGFTGGFQGGYNWQSGNILVGIELDYQYFRSAGSKSVTVPFPSFPGLTMTVTTSMSTDWLFTARPRLGLVSSNWLFYGTGGLAVTRLKGTWSYTDNVFFPAASESASASTTKVGWTVGGGVEVALPGNWLIGGEYLYVKFNKVSTTSTNLVLGPPTLGPDPTTVFSHSADLASNIVRARLSKKF